MAYKDPKVFEDLTKLLDTYVGEAADARDATNKANRTRAAAKKLYPVFLQNEGLDLATTIQIGGVLFSYATAESERIDPRKWKAMLDKGEITEDQYYDAITVGKEIATQHIGQDQVSMITGKVKGTTVDIRAKDAEKYVKGVKVNAVNPPSPKMSANRSLRSMKRNLTLPKSRLGAKK